MAPGWQQHHGHSPSGGLGSAQSLRSLLEPAPSVQGGRRSEREPRALFHLLILPLLFLFLLASTEVADCEFVDDGPLKNVITEWTDVCVIEFGHLHLAQLRVLKLIKDKRSNVNPVAAAAYAGHFVLRTFHWENQVRYDFLLQTQLRALNLTTRQKIQARQFAIRVALPIVRNRVELVKGALDFYEKVPSPPNGPPGVFQTGSPLGLHVVAAVGGSPPLIADQPQAYGRFMPGLPPIPSPIYNADLKEVRLYGARNGSLRSKAQDEINEFFTAATTFAVLPKLGIIIAKKLLPSDTSIYDTAYVFAALAIGYYDVAIAVAWGKWTHYSWRPQTAIRQGDSQNAPVPDWTAIAGTTIEPEYPSGYAAVAAVIKPALEDYLGTENTTFFITTTVTGSSSNLTRTYHSLSQFAQEIYDYRILIGAHFRFAVQAGQRVGNAVAEDIVKRLRAEYYGKSY
ncbi:hypothetical protein CBR_g24298 [Chara braunii]|uniref:Phosphatidic acid phosphatase type 2/haloperoxidase domain-containing protein n=1 Tax=Chara braunii TaxID=69332 RepID=A0A388JMB9_CHABU|nr:hypothetical protein CBR_g24298 [Chara braunii]|eukprot:GBG58947.1 hypothetical protein CBR_g24298 [Chara braunii]